MYLNEAEKLMRDTVLQLWPRWKPNATEVEAWTRKVTQYSSKLVEDAAMELVASNEGRFDRPKLADLLTICRRMSADLPQRKEQQHQENICAWYYLVVPSGAKVGFWNQRAGIPPMEVAMRMAQSEAENWKKLYKQDTTPQLGECYEGAMR
jgi:hypothetical protein